MKQRFVRESISLPEFVKESQRRAEEVEVYLVNRKTGEVVFCGINPNFVAGIMKFGESTDFKLT